ncbi:cell surface protein required for swimming motility [Synechococcus sp. BOUM118]|nr:cell surface protein required for swimming motility [Synechococcus sp. BOUM118]
MTSGSNAKQLVLTLADNTVAPIAQDQKVYVSYTGTDLQDAATNVVTKFTKVIDVSASSTALAATDGITTAAVDSTGKIITLTFDENLETADPAAAGFTITIGDQSYAGATFLSTAETNASNAKQLVLTLANDSVAPIAQDQKVYVSYTGTDLQDAATNVVTKFTKVIDVSASSTAVAATDGVVSTLADTTGKIITLTFDENLETADPSIDGFKIYVNNTIISGSSQISSIVTDASNPKQLILTMDSGVNPIVRTDSVFVVYNGSDLDDSASNRVPNFTKLVDVANVADVNKAPVLFNSSTGLDISNIAENTFLSFTSSELLSYILDPNNDTLDNTSIISVSVVDKSTGMVVPNSTLTRVDSGSSSQFTYSPGDFSGTATLSVVVSDISDSSRDSSTALSTTFTADFEVYSANDSARYNPNDSTKPTLATATLSSSSNQLTLYFSEAVNSSAILENNLFKITRTPSGGSAESISYTVNRSPLDFGSDSTSITLTLDKDSSNNDVVISATDTLDISYGQSANYLSPGSLVQGQRYSIVTPASAASTFTSIGATSNTAGLVFTATGSGVDDGVGKVLPFSIFDNSLSLITPGSFVSGEQYLIASLGTSATDFTAIGSPVNSVGTIFTATGNGSGNGNGNAYLINPLTAFSSSVNNGKQVTPLLSTSTVSLDGKTLTLDFTRALDSSDVVVGSTFTVQKYNSTTSSWSDIVYSVDGDSSDYSNSNSSIVLLLQDAVTSSDVLRISYSGTSLQDSTESHNLSAFSNSPIRNLSTVFRLESLSSTKSVIYEDLGFDGTPTTAQITSLASESTHAAGSFVVGNYYTIHSVGSTDWTSIGATDTAVGTTFKATGVGSGSGVASTNYEILDSEILSKYYDVESSTLALYNVTADHGSFVRNDANTGWLYRPDVNFAGQAIVNFDVFDGASFTPGSASLDVQAINDLPVRIAGNVSGIIIPEGTSTDSTSPELSYASVNGSSLTLNFSESLDSTIVLNANTFDIFVDGSEVVYQVNGDATDYAKSGTAVVLQLANAVSAGQTVSVSYSSSTIKDTAFVPNLLESIQSSSVINITGNDNQPPVLTSASVASDGQSVSLIFSEQLDNSIVLGNDTFGIEVSTDGVNWTSAPYSISTNSAAYVDGSTTINLTLNSSVDYQALVRIYYQSTSIKDVSDNALAVFSTGSEVALKNYVRVPLGLSSLEYSPGLGDDESINASTKQTLTYTVTDLPSASLGQLQKIDGTPVLNNTAYTIDEIRSFQFESNPGSNGSTSFTLKVQDSSGAFIEDNISIGTTFVNDGPVLSGTPFDFQTLSNATKGPDEDTTITITKAQLLQGFTDEEGNALFVNGLSASNGVLQTSDSVNGPWSFTPVQDFVGTVNLLYVVNDSDGAGQLATNSFSILAVNDKPIRSAGSISTLTLLEDGPIASMGLPSTLAYASGGGSDESSQNLTITVSFLPVDANGDSAGTVYLSDGTTNVSVGDVLSIEQLRSLKFTPAESIVGTFDFKYTVADDGSNNTSAITSTNANIITETVQIQILNFNDTPVLPTSDITFGRNGVEDTVFTFDATDLLRGVTDPDFTYDTDGNYVDNPFGDVLTVSSLSATNGSVSGPDADGNYSFTPNANFNGVASFNYLVNDGQGGSVSNTVNLQIDAVNDAPVATFVSQQFGTENGGTINGQLTATDIERSRSESSGATLSYSASGAAVDGVTINADGSYAFDTSHNTYNYLALGQTLDIAVAYRVTDDLSLLNENTFTITLTGSNDDPYALGNTISALTNGTEDTVSTFTIADLTQGYSDYDLTDVLTVQSPVAYEVVDGVTTNQIIGTFTRNEVNGALQSYNFMPSADFVGDLEVKFTVSDSRGPGIGGSATLTISEANDAPIPTFAVSQVASEAGELVTGQLTAEDTEVLTGEKPVTSLVYSLPGDAIPGLVVNGNGSFSFDPTNAAYEYLAVGEEQVITVNYRVTDAGDLFAEKTFTITVKGTNDDPVVDLNGIATLANATEDTAYEVTVTQLLQGFSDVDTTDVLVVQGLTAFKADANGNVLDEVAGTISRVEANGVLTGYQFAPVTDYNGKVVLKYTVVDGNGPGIAGSLDLAVDAVNDTPVPTFAINQVASEAGELVTGTLTADDIEIGTGEELATSLTYSLSGDAIAGLLINADGSFSFDPKNAAYEYLAVGEEQVITVNYRVTDPGLNGAAGLFAEKTFTITVKGTNDDPVVNIGQVTIFNAAIEDTEYLITTADLLQGFSDVDNSDVLSVTSLAVYKATETGLASAESGGSLAPVIENDLVTGYKFMPLDDYFGDVVFTYTVTDGNGPGANSSFTLSVTPVEDVPRLGNFSENGLNLGDTSEDTITTFTAADLLDGFTDPDGLDLSIKADSVSSPYATITSDGDTYTFAPNLNFSGSTQIYFTVLDAAGNEVPFSKFINVIEVNDPPSITLDRVASSEDYKSKTYLVPLSDIFAEVPANPVVELLDLDSAITTQIIGDTLSIGIPAEYTDDVSFMFGETAVDPTSLYTLEVHRPLQVADRNVVAGFERFFTLSDFGFGDIEGLPLQSVLIQVPNSSLGSIRVGAGNFDTDTENVNQLVPVASSDFNQSNVYEVTREQIESGSIYFASNPSPLNAGNSADLEFTVKDESGDISTLPGLIRITIQEPPQSVQDFVADSKYKPIFDSELGLHRFESIDSIVSTIGITRDEALSVIRATLPSRTADNSFDANVSNPFSFVNQNEVEYRWDIGFFDISVYDPSSNTQETVLDFSSLSANSDLYQHFVDLNTYSLTNELDNSYLASKLVEQIPGAADRLVKITDAFALSRFDDIYGYLTSSGVNGPEILDVTNDNTQKLFVRLYSAIASAPILSNSFTEGRDLLVQSVLDLINPTTSLPNRLIDNLNNLYSEKTSSLDSTFVLPTGTRLSPEGLDRLNQVTRLVGTGGSSDLLAASGLSSNSSDLLSSLSNQDIISDDGSLLNSFGQPVLSEGEPVVISDYQSMVDTFVDPILTTFTPEFLENDSITGDLARTIVLNEISVLVVDAADSTVVPEAISSTLNNLLAASLEVDPESPDAKSESNRLLKTALSVDALLQQRPIYEIDEETGEPKTVFDPRSNTEVFVVNEKNEAFYNAAQEQQDILYADYVGLTLEQWKDIDNQPNAAKVKADRLNSVKIGITYSDYVNFANLDPLDSEAWSIYPFVGYDEKEGIFESGDFLVVDNLFVDPQAALNNLISSGSNKGVSFDDFSSLLFNQPIYSPSSVSSDSGADISRADASTYASIDPSSALYIAPMDSNFQEGSITKAYKTSNPNPYKFTIENFEDASLMTDGRQVSYLVNYTFGDLQISDSGYTFNVTDGYSPDLVGHDVDEFDIVLKYVSEFDLLSYGATPVEAAPDQIVEPGEQVFTWDSNPDNIIDKYGQQSSVLYDLDGREITKAGWYDFTLRPSTDTVFDPELDQQIPVWRDGGRYIYADYYTVDIGNFLTDNDPSNDEILIPANSWYVPSQSDLLDETEGVLPDGVAFRRIVGLELNFTDNSFGDKDPQLGRVVDPFGAGAESESSSLFTSNFTTDNLFAEEPPDPKFVLKRNEKKVLKTAVILPPEFKAVESSAVVIDETQKAVAIDSVVLDETQKAVDINAVILEDDEVAVSKDLLVSDELFTSNVDLTDLRIVDENAVILALNEKAVDIDAVILEDDQIAISRDLLVTDELFTSDVDLSNLRLVDKDAVVLEPTQKAVDIEDVVLLDNQIAVNDDAVILDPTEKAVDINAIILLDDEVAFNIDDVPVSLDGLKLVPDDAVVLDPNQQAVDVNTEILQPDQKAVPLDAPEVANDASGSGKYKQPPSDIKQSGSGVDAPGISDIAALKFGDDAPGTGNGDGDGQGAGSSNSSGSGVGVSMNEQATQFPEGEGDGDSDSVEQRGQGAPGQGDGEGGEAALGDDQTPTTQRKRGLMLQPIVESESVDEDAKSSSTLLKNLSEGSIMGTNLLDALTLGGGILYALYAPQAVKPIKRTFGSLLGRLTGRSTSIPERKVATVFAMKLPDGTQRLIAAKVTTQSIDIIAQQDMPSGMSVTQAGNQEQVDFAFNQLLDKITNESFDLILVGPRLRNQSSLVAKLASDSLILDTSSIEQKLKSCSQDEVKSLQQWLDRPSSTPPESNPVKDLLSVRQSDYSKSLMTQQASMASLVELSVALSWKD